MKRTLLWMLSAAPPVLAQINAGHLAASENPPFVVTKVAQFDLPWRMAFLPDGRMLITQKGGKLIRATSAGEKLEVGGVPRVHFENQNGLLGVYLAPDCATHHGVYLTYSEPGTTRPRRASRWRWPRCGSTTERPGSTV